MRPDSLFAALGAVPNYAVIVFSLLYLLVSIYVYISLIRQISARTSAPVGEPTKRFGLPEAILAAALIGFLLLNISSSVSRPAIDLGTRNLLVNLVFTLAILLFIVTFLQLRGFDIGSLAGLFKIGLFRFFLYGVIRRYFGRFFGITVNALLFAAAHTHLPSFVPLFVLGSCFTIAYEWSGSILVAMTMHSLFNSVTLTALAFPEIFSQ